jgi:hypothetical protein
MELVYTIVKSMQLGEIWELDSKMFSIQCYKCLMFWIMLKLVLWSLQNGKRPFF